LTISHCGQKDARITTPRDSIEELRLETEIIELTNCVMKGGPISVQRYLLHATGTKHAGHIRTGRSLPTQRPYRVRMHKRCKSTLVMKI
jgi:hypothetical protein